MAVTKSGLTPPLRCAKCGAEFDDQDRFCPACEHDVGCPNVRQADSPTERSALKLRYATAKRIASKNKCKAEFANLSDCVEKSSCVVVCMPAAVARDLANDPRQIYQNYEGLVAGGIRRAATPENDRQRYGVDGTLFGSIAKYLRCGVLSLTTEGLPTYGDVHCRLKEVAIKDRVSFLEMNSYAFVRTKRLVAGDAIPAGFRSVWSNRYELAMAKLGGLLRPRTNKPQWQKVLVRSDAKDRANDDFVEAHIFGGFNVGAIEEMIEVAKHRHRKDPTIVDIRVALERFAAQKKKQ